MLAALPDPKRRYTGPLYRALNPIYARDPLSGMGAQRFGGRFNLQGRAALYTAMSVMGAVSEANQIGRPFEPVVLVSYECDLDGIFDATDAGHLAAHAVDAALLGANDWRLQMIRDGASYAQTVAARLAKAGYQAMMVPSFAPGVAASARNLVLWQWQGLRVVDTEGRLK